MNLRKLINKDSLFKEYVNILNGVLKLSKRECQVLSFILEVDAATIKSYISIEGDDINSKIVRTAITKTLCISEPNLSKYLNTLKDKGIIVRGSNNKWVVNDNIRPLVTSGILELIFTLEIDGGIKKSNNDSASGMVSSNEI